MRAVDAVRRVVEDEPDDSDAHDGREDHRNELLQHVEHRAGERKAADERVVDEPRPEQAVAVPAEDELERRRDRRAGEQRHQAGRDDHDHRAGGEHVLAGLREERAEVADSLRRGAGEQEAREQGHPDHRRLAAGEVERGPLPVAEHGKAAELQCELQEEEAAAQVAPAEERRARAAGGERLGLERLRLLDEAERVDLVGELEHVGLAVTLAGVEVADAVALECRRHRPAVDRPRRLLHHELDELAGHAAASRSVNSRYVSR